MGIKRVVDTDFWEDDKVMLTFSPEDKLFFLYIMTNPHTTQLGVYKILAKQMAFELGYSLDTIDILLDRFESKYDVIKYSKTTKEIAIKNYLRYSVVKGGKPVLDLLVRESKEVKDKRLLRYIRSGASLSENETVKYFISNYLNDNDNDNDNDDSYHESYDESYHESSKAVKPIDAMFDRFWKSYPRKVAKENARKAFAKLKPNDDLLNAMLSAIDKQKKSEQWTKDGGQFIPHPTTWLNQHRWEDEMQTNDSICTFDPNEAYDLRLKRTYGGMV